MTTHTTLHNSQPAPLVIEPDGVLLTSPEVALLTNIAVKLAEAEPDLTDETIFIRASEGLFFLHETGTIMRYEEMDTGDILYEDTLTGEVSNISERFRDMAEYIEARVSGADAESETPEEREINGLERHIEEHIQHAHEALLGVHEAVTEAFSRLDALLNWKD
jgi:hypothetical protein